LNDLMKSPRIGDVFLMKFDGIGSEQGGVRPGLVFQNNLGNKFSPNIIALPLTSSLKKLNLPTHVFLPSDDTGLLKDSVVLCENPERMSKDRLGDFLTTLPDEYMAKIAEASILATSAISYIDPKSLMALWKKAIKYNTANC